MDVFSAPAPTCKFAVFGYKSEEINTINLMAHSASKLVANSMLMFSSCLCLKSTPSNMRYARHAFRLYLASSVIGTLATILNYATLKDLHETIWVWCYCLCIPLLATDLCVLSPYVPDTGPLQLAIPLYNIVTYYFFPPHVDPLLLSMSHSFSILFLALCSAWDGHLCGYVLAFLHFFTMWRMESDENTHIDWTLHMALSNFLAQNVLGIDVKTFIDF